MTPYDFLVSLWRTLVLLLVGVLAAWLARIGIGVDSAAATVWLGQAGAAAYYALFRFLEARVSPRWGWLLGLARPPRYPDRDADVAALARRDR